MKKKTLKIIGSILIFLSGWGFLFLGFYWLHPKQAWYVIPSALAMVALWVLPMTFGIILFFETLDGQ